MVIVAAAALLLWAFSAFRSWRFRAQIDPGHQLVTGGPFAFVRHPIYLAISLLGLGTLVWMSTPVVAAGAALVALGGDRRARSEEKLLAVAFGDAYRAYMGRVKRFVPGVY